jgi:hypothetical protein
MKMYCVRSSQKSDCGVATPGRPVKVDRKVGETSSYSEWKCKPNKNSP